MPVTALAGKISSRIGFVKITTLALCFANSATRQIAHFDKTTTFCGKFSRKGSSVGKMGGGGQFVASTSALSVNALFQENRSPCKLCSRCDSMLPQTLRKVRFQPL